MQLLRIESDVLLAWVSPLAGGLADLSVRAGDAAPRPLLRRSPPELDGPSWLALRPRLGSPFEGAEVSAWKILDRTPLSARLGFASDGDGACTVRYELTPEGLLIELDAELPEPAPLAGAVLVNGLGPGVEIETRVGMGRVLLHDRCDAKCPISTRASGSHSVSMLIRPEPSSTS